MDQLLAYLRSSTGDDLLASYLVSPALTLYLRRGRHRGDGEIRELSFAPLPQWDLLLVKELLPEEVSGLRISASSFPRLTIDGLELREMSIDACDFEALRIQSAVFDHCALTGVECRELRLGGAVTFRIASLTSTKGR